MTKEAQITCQIRARCYKEGKRQFWKDLINIYKGIFLHSRQYIFSLFLIKSDALYIHDTFTSTRDEILASKSSPKKIIKFQENLKIHNTVPSLFQPIPSTQTCS